MKEENGMLFKDYQDEVKRTMSKGEFALANYCMGLTGEAGETVDMFKKYLFHGHPLDMGNVVKELGDVMWYISAIANELDLSMDEIAVCNLEKLRKRYPDGFSKSASINRIENKK